MCCALQRVVSDLQTLLRPRNINSTVYSAMTVAFLGIGASYIWAPPELVTKIIAHANTPDAMVLWRSIGATLLVLPSWGVTLKVTAPAADSSVTPYLGASQGRQFYCSTIASPCTRSQGRM